MRRITTAVRQHPARTFIILLGGIIAMTLFGLSRGSDSGALKVGQTAPDFSLRDQENRVQRLADYRGQWVVLYFYPKDDTPGCTTEACNFRDDIHLLHRLNAQVLGVSIDSTESHEEFAEKYHLPFPLLADREGNVSAQYGARFSLGPVQFSKRHTFLIDPDGRIARIYREVKPKQHSSRVIDALEALREEPG
ncbi:peroxiredoxin [Thiohalorhabdus sp. Cl-TMA]|uniref:thioredoxin-dependent peroxiredoxin n=1 Tax=Thiohalorhabdus methylotrophus TaxID=3242694 RepID=A0ABV4TWS2_9GAMM